MRTAIRATPARLPKTDPTTTPVGGGVLSFAPLADVLLGAAVPGSVVVPDPPPPTPPTAASVGEAGLEDDVAS